MTAQPVRQDLLPALQRSTAGAFAPIQREFNRLFDDLSNGWNTWAEFALAPRMDFRETKDGVELTLEVPGIDRKDIKIDVEGDLLTVSGEKRVERDNEEDHVRVAERSYGAFSRAVVLPRTIDANAIKAALTDGVLKITAPKRAGAAGKTISIDS